MHLSSPPKPAAVGTLRMSKYISSSPRAHAKDMARRVANSDGPQGEDTDTQLAVMLSAPGKKERKPWGELCNLTQEMRSLVLGYPDAQGLLGQIMGLVVEKFCSETGVDHSNKAIPLLRNLIILVADQLNKVTPGNSVHASWDTSFSQEKVEEPNDCYTVLSIFQTRSSGESYVPSPIFRAMFPVMDPKFERMQTRKGIWISRCIESSMLILDINGLDQRQGGEDTSFDNQAALFALTASDIMLVSISISNNGLEKGGIELFKTIFKERIKLNLGLTKIAVVVQNYDGKTPFETLRKYIMETLEQIWTFVNEKSKAFTECVEIIEVAGVRAKNAEDFRQQVTSWKRHLSTTVPNSDFSVRSKLLWDQIEKHQTFDVPSHMMLLATLYCQQTAEAPIGYLEDKEFKAEGSPLGFTEVARTLVDMRKSYYTSVTDKEREKMVNKDLIMRIQEKQFKVKNGCTNCDVARDAISTEEGGDELLNYYENAVEPYIMVFTNLCEDLKIVNPELFQNNYGTLQKELTLYIALHILSLKEEDARCTLEAEQIRFDKDIETLTVRLDQRTEVKQRRELKLQQEKEQLNQEFKMAKEELEHAKNKIAEFERTVQLHGQTKENGQNEESELIDMVRQINGKCDKNTELITQILEQMEGHERPKKGKSYLPFMK